MGTLNFSTSNLNKGMKLLLTPSKFEGKTTTDAASPHVFSATGWMDITFVDVDFVASGDFSYVGGILTYTGDDDLDMTFNMSCAVECNVKNVEVHIAQWQNGVEVKGSQNVNNSESNTSKVPFSIDSPFTLQKNDTLNLRLKASAACTVNLYHFSVVLEPNKVELD